VKLLIASHCNVNVCNKTGETALYHAAYDGHSECVKLLIDNHCYVNVSNSNANTAIIQAAHDGHSE
jgi:CDK inhibitor PHO81